MSDFSFIPSTQTKEDFSRLPQIILSVIWFFIITPTLGALAIFYVEMLPLFRARMTRTQLERRPKEATVNFSFTK